MGKHRRIFFCSKPMALVRVRLCEQRGCTNIKEFIYRQYNILRGIRGLVTSTNRGSAAAVGNVVVAASAASRHLALLNFHIWRFGYLPIS